MNVEPNDAQKMMIKIAREFIKEHVPMSFVREMEDDPKGFTPEMWQEMTNLGWPAWIIPEEYDGVGGSFLEVVSLLEEMGRACVPGPLFSTVILGAMTLLDGGNEEQKKELLTKVSNGEITLTMALTEPSACWKASSISMTATPSGDDYIFNGTKLFVPDAHVADWIICVARTAEGKTPEEGITLFLVDAKSPGISCNLLDTIFGNKQCEVIFQDVKVPAKNTIGEPNQGWELVERALQRAAVGKCLEMVGQARQALDMSVEFAKQRVQFGRPIGSLQAIQHYCSNMAMDTEGARLIAYKAAWMVDQGLPCAKEVAMAKAYVNKACHNVVAKAHQIHGAIGYTEEHDIGLYYRRAKGAELAYGDDYFHLDRLQAEMSL